MAINYNNKPYYDDFNPTKNYYRILFKPEVAAQSRELTQLQTIGQYQTSLFASSIYGQNSPVTGGNVTTNLNCYYVKLNDTYNNRSVDVSVFKNATIVDSTGLVKAEVIAVAESTGSTQTGGEPPTLIVNYLSGSMFENNTVVYVKSESQRTPYAITSNVGEAGSCTGLSSTASITDGVYFVMNGTTPVLSDAGETKNYKIGHFVEVAKQTVILEKYSNTPTMRVGLNIVEQTITVDSDETLNDPAVGASNYSAPGADRYQIKLVLETRPKQLGDDDNFIELVKYQNGVIEKQVDSSVYSDIDDYFAKRTFDTNGDFVVNDFSITPEVNEDPDKYNLKVGKGLAYVRGYRIENQSDYVLTNDRARETQSINNNYVYFNYGSYFYVSNLFGTFAFNQMTEVDLHIVPYSQVNVSNTSKYNSTLAGKAYILGFDYVSATNEANTATYVYKAHVSNVTTNSLSANVISYTSSTSTLTFAVSDTFNTTNSIYNNCTVTISDGTGKGYVGVVDSYTVNSNIASVKVSPSISSDVDTTSIVTIVLGTKDIQSIVEKKNTTINAHADIDKSSKVGGIETGNTQLKSTNNTELISRIGQSYVDQISDTSYTTSTLLTGTFSSGSPINLTVSSPSNTTFEGRGKLSDSAARENFTVIISSGTNAGKVLYFGGNNTITISADGTSASFSSTEYSDAISVNIIAKLNVTDADNSPFVRSKTKIEGDTTHVNTSWTTVGGIKLGLANGQILIPADKVESVGKIMSLYTIDVIRIKKIIDTKSASTSPTDQMLSNSSYDITSSYSLDNGQRNAFYDHAGITLLAGRKKPSGNVLVVFDYYSHSSGNGYFSVDSYPNKLEAYENYYVSDSGNTYRLSDCIDFRPSRTNGTQTFGIDSKTLLPVDETNFICDYTSYLGRNDLLVLTKDSNFEIIQGTSSINPVYPATPDGSLVLARITHDPYTLYIAPEANGGFPSMSIIRVRNKRWTMKDITGLQTRIDNLEYYTSLNLLEQSAKSLQVPDENGLNRFKNGILVDNFSSYSVADSSSPDFNASIDTLNGELSATRNVRNFQLRSEVMLNSLSNPDSANFAVNSINTGTSVFMLPYTSESAVVQQLASNTVNLNPFGVTNYNGTMSLNPPMDNWVDNEKNPDILLIDPNMTVYQQSNTLNVLKTSNWQTIPGSQQTKTTSSSRTYNTGNSTVGSTVRETTYTSVTTSSQKQDVTMGYWESVGNNYSTDNGFITDIGVQPYIRAQDVMVFAQGLKTNTKISAYFDGVNVDQYFTNSDIIHLTSVSGTFNKNDVIGYIDSSDGSNAFVAIGIVSNVIESDDGIVLSVVSDYHTNHNISNATITNAQFNQNGNYVGYTASGTASSNKIIEQSFSGSITSVGNQQVVKQNGTAVSLFSNKTPSHTALMQLYGVWNSQDSSSGTFDVTFDINVDTAGTYYMWSAGSSNVQVYINSTLIRNGTATCTNYYNTITLNSGKNTCRVVNDTATHTHKEVGCAISTEPWTDVGTTGDVIWSTRTPLIYSSKGFTSTYDIDGGGKYYTGVTEVCLNATANENSDFYVGSTISITSVSINSEGDIVTNSFNTKVVQYDGVTRMATLMDEVEISVGYNSIVGGDISSIYSIQGNSVITSEENSSASGLSTNDNGEYSGVFSIPAGVFRTGERVLRLDNRTVENDPDSATTWAESTFTASGLSTKSTSLNFSASIDSAKNTFTSTNTRTTSSTSTWTRSQTIRRWDNRDPVCQTFILDEEQYPNGLYLTGVKLFFKNKPLNSSAPVTVSIIGTTNGYPNGETLDNSNVTLTSDKINVSEAPHYLDETTYTNFVFPSPVFIMPETLYAILVNTDSVEYDIWVAAQNATAIASTTKNLPSDPIDTNDTKIGSTPYVGSLFESQNSITWVAEPNKSLMFVLDRCVFDTSAEAKIKYVVPKNNPSRKNISTEVQFHNISELTSNVRKVYDNNDIEIDAINFTTTDYIPSGTDVKYSFIAKKQDGQLASEEYTTPGKYGCPTYQNIYFDDGTGARILTTNSTDSIQFFADLSTTDNAVSPSLSDDGITVYTVENIINNLGLVDTSLEIISGGNNYSANTKINISTPDFGQITAELEPVIENGVIVGINIIESGEGYLNTPTITVVDTDGKGSGASIVAHSEYSPTGGNALVKYVTNRNTLTEDNDSQDLRTYLTAYKPNGSDIRVFYKVLSRDDSQNFDEGNWQLMTTINNNRTYSSTRDEYIEYVFAPGVGNNADGQISYVSTNGNTYTDFYQFAIKIVITTSDKTKVPVIKSMVTLALPSSK